jgi:hypothetical protein
MNNSKLWYKIVMQNGRINSMTRVIDSNEFKLQQYEKHKWGSDELFKENEELMKKMILQQHAVPFEFLNATSNTFWQCRLHLHISNMHTTVWSTVMHTRTTKEYEWKYLEAHWHNNRRLLSCSSGIECRILQSYKQVNSHQIVRKHHIYRIASPYDISWVIIQ